MELHERKRIGVGGIDAGHDPREDYLPQGGRAVLRFLWNTKDVHGGRISNEFHSILNI
jgi:hypothetical protein